MEEYTINEVAEITGITAYTLRYYESIGVLPTPARTRGSRRYSDQDVQLISFIQGLKQTGMKLSEIALFMEDGCILSPRGEQQDWTNVLEKRIRILTEHMKELDARMQEVARVKAAAAAKCAYYAERLQAKKQDDGQRIIK